MENNKEIEYRKQVAHDNYIKLMNGGYITSYNNLKGRKIEKVNNNTKEAIHDNYMKVMNGGYKTSIVKDEDVKGL